jgi:hypothetical protein
MSHAPFAVTMVIVRKFQSQHHNSKNNGYDAIAKGFYPCCCDLHDNGALNACVDSIVNNHAIAEMAGT